MNPTDNSQQSLPESPSQIPAPSTSAPVEHGRWLTAVRRRFSSLWLDDGPGAPKGLRYISSATRRGSVAGILGANVCRGYEPERTLQPLADSCCWASDVILGGIKRTRFCIDRRVESVAKPAMRGVHER
jgi:hypothetical protein